MGTKLVRVAIKEQDIDFPAVPPGFESFTSIKLERVEETKKEIICALPHTQAKQPFQCKSATSYGDVRKVNRPPRHGASMKSDRCYVDSDGDSDSDSDLLDQKESMRPLLPKGVIRGSSDCNISQRVVARCRPEAACRPNLEEVPVFYPREEEFHDTISYIAKIQPVAEAYGICRIIPPSSWKPPCQLREKKIWENAEFVTRIQKVDKLQNRDPRRKDLKATHHMKKKQRRCTKMGMDSDPLGGNVVDATESEFGFEPGPSFTLDAFQRYADDFKGQYFEGMGNMMAIGADATKLPGKCEASVETIEGEYWRVVEKPTEEVEVLYGADLETGAFGSGFPRTFEQVCSPSDEQYVKSGWNLNNLPRLSGSVLAYENPDISGVQVPWLYVGMCFSSFCWHVEDHFLYSLNYMHFGAPKMWYGVPGEDATKFEEAMRKHLPDLFKEQPNLLHKLITQLSPNILKAEGVPVYRCTQYPGEFVLTFPRAYHGGFNCGFNCAEAVNLAPLDWFPRGQSAVELYREQGRKTTISHDKLLLGAANEAVKANWQLKFLRKGTPDNLRWTDAAGRNGILAKSLRARVDMERVRRDFLCNSSRTLKMLNTFDATTERECCVCSFDLHLSAAACRCSPDKYACLNHVKQLCPCAWTDKFFLFRYNIGELDLLVEAVEGKLRAVYKWARSYLGLSLSSEISRDNAQVSGLNDSSSSINKKVIPNEPTCQPLKEASLETPSQLAFHMGNSKDVKVNSNSLSDGSVSSKFRIKRVVRKLDSIPQYSILGKGEVIKKQSWPEGVICLSDDERDHSDHSPSGSVKVTDIVTVEHDERLDLSDNDVTSTSTSATIKTNAKCEVQPSVGQPTNIHSHQAASCTVIRDSVQSLDSEDDLENVVPAQQIFKAREEATTLRLDHATIIDDVGSHPGSPSCTQNYPNKYNRHKGPRIAKVVRRINLNVEPLEYGAVVHGRSWCNSSAIFPNGFRSRVRYINILDPPNMCYYISEVLDGGSRGPLFMVSLEQCPSEVFVHISPTKCWDMVLNRVNRAIAKQHQLGKLKLPPIQPPGCLDGFEMFGFASPSIVQAIEALDKNRICREYWNSRPLTQTLECIQSEDQSGNAQSKYNDADLNGVADTILRGLLKKANPEELDSLLCLLNEGSLGFLNQLLDEEIHQRLR